MYALHLTKKHVDNRVNPALRVTPPINARYKEEGSPKRESEPKKKKREKKTIIGPRPSST